jgi:predicted PurR-regulated permease PerM
MPDRREAATWLVLAIATALAFYLCWKILEPMLDVLLWAVVLVVVFYPVHRRLVNQTGRPTLSAAATCLIVLLVLVIPLGLVVLAVLNETGKVAAELPRQVKDIADYLLPWVREYTPALAPYFEFDETAWRDFLNARLQYFASALSRQTLGLATSIAETALQVMFVAFTMFYLFRDGPTLLQVVRDRLPLQGPQCDAIFRRAKEMIRASVHGVLVIAVIQGSLAGLAFWVLGIPSPLLWTLVMIILSTIPIAGSFLVWIPAAIYLLATGHWVKALLLAAWCGGVVGSVDNFLRPKLVGGRAGLHELFIFFAVLGGLQVFGILGIILGPLTLAVTLALFEAFRRGEGGSASAAPAAPTPAANESPPPPPDVPQPKAEAGPAPANK